MRKLIFSLIIFVVSLAPRSARADLTIDVDGRWRLEGAAHVSYMIAGGSAVRGGRAPATGGATFIPTLRVSYARRFFDPYAALAPMVVTPYNAQTIGFVGAHDLGLSWHPDTRAWSIGTAATLAPSYMRFANASWSLRQPIILYGGEAHFTGSVLHTEGGGGLRWNVAVRALTGRPTAWTWPGLTAEEKKLNRLSWVIGGGASWTF